MNKNNTNRETLTLGMIKEVIPYDFTNMGWEAQGIIESIYTIMYTELVNRDIFAMWGWSARTVSMLTINKLYTVGQVMFLERRDIDRLIRCGPKTQQEIYDTFASFNIELPAWNSI